jgi:hypothetical protein
MRPLKESILDDMDKQMNKGNNFIKTYKKAEKELNDIKKRCSDLSNWAVYERNTMAQYTIFIQCSKLSSHFELNGKNLLIELVHHSKTDYNNWGGWYVNYKLTNARWPYYDEGTPWGQHHLYVKSYNLAIQYNYEEIGQKPTKGNDSKYTPEQIIEKFILSKFGNMEIFEKELVNVSKALEKENVGVKYIDGPNI